MPIRRGARAIASVIRPSDGRGPGTVPEAAMCVQDVDVQCVLQFTLVHAAGCALHRRASRVIHRSEVYALLFFPQLARSRAAGAGGEGETLSLSFVRDGSLEVCGPGRPYYRPADRWPDVRRPGSGSLSRRLPRLCASGTRQAPREKRSLVFLLVGVPAAAPEIRRRAAGRGRWGAGARARRCVVRSSRVFSVEKPSFR